MRRPLPLHMIKDATKHNELYVYCILAGKGRFYGWSYAHIASYSRLSHTLLRKRIPELIKLGWAEIQGNDLIIHNTDKLLKHKHETVVPIRTTRNKKETILQFRYAILRGNITAQAKAISKHSERVKKVKDANGKLSKKDMLVIKKSGGEQSYVSKAEENAATALSNRSIGKLVLRSQSTGKRLQKALRSAKLITSKARVKVLAENCSKAEWLYSPVSEVFGAIYNPVKQLAYRRKSNEIALC